MIDTSILPPSITKLVCLATLLGFLVMVAAAFSILGAALWGMTWLLGAALMHISSTQLLLMLFVGYATHTQLDRWKGGKTCR